MDLVSHIATKLKNYGVASGRVNAEIMLCGILRCSRIELYINNVTLNINQRKQLDEMVNRRINGEPLQYIMGRTNFYGNEFLIEPGVFIPRPETEILVDTVLSLITDPSSQLIGHEPLIFEIGTGCGNIAISLTKAYTDCKIIASDISEKAIALAKRNASLNGVSERIVFIKADLFCIPKRYKGAFDIIVSNPPYVAHERLTSLSVEVQKEPFQALNGGRYGMGFYSSIIKGASLFLKKDGIIALELADGIHGKVKKLFKSSGQFDNISIFKDLNGLERVITARRIP